jgi:hypothetical protein
VLNTTPLNGGCRWRIAAAENLRYILRCHVQASLLAVKSFLSTASRAGLRC